jgi:hypothetical protein
VEMQGATYLYALATVSITFAAPVYASSITAILFSSGIAYLLALSGILPELTRQASETTNRTG